MRGETGTARTPGARPRSTRARVTLAGSIATVVAATAWLAGCAPERGSGPVVITPSTSPTAPAASAAPAVRPVGDPETLATGLESPWSILRLPDGGVLVSERDRGRIVEVLPDGGLREAAVLPDVVAGGEGGLLGLAFLPGDGSDAASGGARRRRGWGQRAGRALRGRLWRRSSGTSRQRA